MDELNQMPKCIHEGCSGNLLMRSDERTGPNVFECDVCHCVYRLVNVRKEVGCPSLKHEKPHKKGIKVYVNVGEGSQPVIKESFVTGEADVVENQGDQQIIKDLKTNAGDQIVIKRGRGRPKGSKNKK